MEQFYILRLPRGFDRERTKVHKLQYQFIWCPKYRKSVLEGEVRDRLEELIQEKANELDLEVMELAIHPHHVHLFITGDPTLAPNKIMQQVKGYSSRRLRDEFDFGLPSLWTRSYFVSGADDVPHEVIKEYIDAQAGE